MQVSKAKNIYLLSEQGYMLLVGFGENEKVMLAKTIAEIHGVELKYINKIINNNIERFGVNDLRDLKSGSFKELQLINLGFTNMQIAKSNNIYLLSERGYTKLVSLMLL